jgi:hypothetical protein
MTRVIFAFVFGLLIGPAVWEAGVVRYADESCRAAIRHVADLHRRMLDGGKVAAEEWAAAWAAGDAARDAQLDHLLVLLREAR